MLSQLAVLTLAVVSIASPVASPKFASIKGRNLVGNGFEAFNSFDEDLSRILAGSTLAKYKQTSRVPRLPILQGLEDVGAGRVERVIKPLRTDRNSRRQASGSSADVPLDNFSGDTLYVGDFSVGSELFDFSTIIPRCCCYWNERLTVCVVISSCSTAPNRFRHR